MGAVRRPDRLQDLVDAHRGRMSAVALDVTDTNRALGLVAEVVDEFGRIDVLVNNAGRTQVVALEETTDAERRDLFDLHFFGPAALTVLCFRSFVGRVVGRWCRCRAWAARSRRPGFGAYGASKFAVDGLTETVSQEVDFGVRFILVEPGEFRTNLFAPGAAHASTEMVEYAATVGPTRDYIRIGSGSQAGDPAKAAQAILIAVNSDHPPLRLVLGADAVDSVQQRLDRLTTELRERETLGRATAFNS